MAGANTKDPEQWTMQEILVEDGDINTATKALKRYLRNHVNVRSYAEDSARNAFWAKDYALVLARLFGQAEGKTAWVDALSGVRFWEWERLYNQDENLPRRMRWSDRKQDLAEGALRIQRMLSLPHPEEYEESLLLLQPPGPVALPSAFLGPHAQYLLAAGVPERHALLAYAERFFTGALATAAPVLGTPRLSASGPGGELLLPNRAAVFLHLLHYFPSRSRKEGAQITMRLERPSTRTYTRAVPGVPFFAPATTAAGAATALAAGSVLTQQLLSLSGMAGRPEQLALPREPLDREGFLYWALTELTAQSAPLAALSSLLEALLEDPAAAAAADRGMEEEEGAATPAPGEPQEPHPPPETGLPPHSPDGGYLLASDSSVLLLGISHLWLLRNHALALPLPGTYGALLRVPGSPILPPEPLKEALMRTHQPLEQGSAVRGAAAAAHGAALPLHRAAHEYQPLTAAVLGGVGVLLAHLLPDGALKYLAGGRNENRAAVARAVRLFDAAAGGAGERLLANAPLGLAATPGRAPAWNDAGQWLLGAASRDVAASAPRRGLGADAAGGPMCAPFAALNREYVAETPVLRALHMPLWHWFRIHLDQAALAPAGRWGDLVHLWLTYLTPWRARAREARFAAPPDRPAAHRLVSGLRASGAGSVPGGRYLLRGVTARWAATLADCFGDFQQCPREYSHYWRGWVAHHYSFYVHLLGVFLARLRTARVDFAWPDARRPPGAPGAGDGPFRQEPMVAALGLPPARYRALELLEAVLDVFEPPLLQTLWTCGYLLTADTQARARAAAPSALGGEEDDGVPGSPLGRALRLDGAGAPPTLHASSAATRLRRWTAWHRAAGDAGDKVLAGALASHANALGVDASAVSETLLPPEEAVAAHAWWCRGGVDAPLTAPAQQVLAGDVQLADTEEGAAALGTPYELRASHLAAVAGRVHLVPPDALFLAPAERDCDAGGAATASLRRHVAGLLVQLAAAIEHSKRARRQLPSAALAQGGTWDAAALGASALKAARQAVADGVAALGGGGRRGPLGPPPARLQYVAFRLAVMFGLEHILEQYDDAVLARAGEEGAPPALSLSGAGEEADAGALPRQRGAGAAAGAPCTLLPEARAALVAGSARCTLADATFAGHASHIPLRGDESACLLAATQRLSTALAQGVVLLQAPAAAAGQHPLTAAHGVKGRWRWLADALGCTPDVLLAWGVHSVAEGGVRLVPAEDCPSKHLFAAGQYLAVPNFLRLLARWRVALALVLLAAVWGAWVGGGAGAVAALAALGAPLLLSLAL